MRKLLLFAFAAFSLACQAQPTINSNVIAPVGAISTYYKSNAANTFNAGNSGANVTWNFATLDTSLGTSTQRIVRADTTPNYSDFPSVVNRAVQVITGFGPEYGYTYLDNSKYEYYGTENFSISQIYIDPEKQLTFPFTYNSQFSDTFYDQWPVYYGNTTVKADAYGTLQLPTGTYQNVLRINVKENYREYDDTNPSDSIFYEGQYYRWYQPNTPNILLEYGKLIKYAIYLGVRYDADSLKHVNITKNPTVTSIEEPSEAFHSIAYPNPATNYWIINSEAVIAKAEVFDLCGKMILQQQFADKHIVIDTEMLAAGSYYVALTSVDKGRKTIRFSRL